MELQILMQDSETLEIRLAREHYEDDSYPLEAIEFQWAENSYRCDCNRHLFFERSIGIDPSPTEPNCGDERYLVLAIDLIRHGSRVALPGNFNA